MNSSTCSKHRTPNYKLQILSTKTVDWLGREKIISRGVWKPCALRSTRVDMTPGRVAPEVLAKGRL